ncbi:hypothetical protein ACQPYH_26330 [Kribbella sp. CA-245084]|uniref:hypothetical protein n=1 Tax=Kribbella sp. CA-245084 TaxID=3239940 RepID=UPI003D8BDB37
MRAVRAEWTKLRTTPGTAWLLVLAAITTVAANHLGLSGVYVGQAPVAVVAVLTVTGEYSNGLIRITLTAMPNRATLMAAKALVLSAVVASVSLLVVGPRAVVYLVLIAILSLGLAAVLRDSAVAVGAVLGLLYLPPILTQLVANPHLRRLLEQIAPMSASLWVLALWSLGAMLVGTLLLRLRDT